MTKQLRTKAFFVELQRDLEQHPNKRLNVLTAEDCIVFFGLFVKLLATSLKSGRPVVFDRFFSFYRKPVKKSGYGMKKEGFKFNFFERVRFKPTDNFRKMTETELTEEEYIERKNQGA